MERAEHVYRLVMFWVRVLALVLLAIGWAKMEQALHASALDNALLFVPLLFLALSFWRATAR